MSRLIDADALLVKWNKLSEMGRKEFDQVIMCEPTFEVENNLMEDCKYRTEDCDNATVCPCLLFVKKQTEDFGDMLQSDLLKTIEEGIDWE